MLPLEDVPLKSHGCPGGDGNVAYPAEQRNLTHTGNFHSHFTLIFNYLRCEDTSHLTPLQTALGQCNTEPQQNTSTPSTERRWRKLSLIGTV